MVVRRFRLAVLMSRRCDCEVVGVRRGPRWIRGRFGQGPVVADERLRWMRLLLRVVEGRGARIELRRAPLLVIRAGARRVRVEEAVA